MPLSLAFDNMEGPHAYTFFTYLNIIGSEWGWWGLLLITDCHGRHATSATLS